MQCTPCELILSDLAVLHYIVYLALVLLSIYGVHDNEQLELLPASTIILYIYPLR